MADDSGIEVDALGGKPGPRSARFAGETATDEENLRALIQAVAGVPAGGRTARYRCVAAIAWPDGREVHAEGVCEGSLVGEAAGDRRIRYDPIFVPAGWDETMAELSAEQKDRISHRGRAFRALREAAGGLFGTRLRALIGWTGARHPPSTRLKVGARPADASCVGETTKPEPRARPARRKLQSTEGFFDGRSPGAVYAVGLTFTVVLFILDWLSGSRISFGAVLPDAHRLVTWNLGRRAGIGAALICTMATLFADICRSGRRPMTWSRIGTPSHASPCSSRSRCCSPH